MTRRCAWCGANLGEKCPRCGSVHVSDISQQDAAGKFLCSCGHEFERGEGGTTHGICGDCRILVGHGLLTDSSEDTQRSRSEMQRRGK